MPEDWAGVGVQCATSAPEPCVCLPASRQRTKTPRSGPLAAVAAALRLQGGALLGAADSFGELSSVPIAPPAVPSPVDTPTGSMATSGGGAAGFGGGAGVPPATGNGSAEPSNPYHSTGSLPAGPSPTEQRAYQSAGPTSMSVGSTTKRFSEPEAQPAVALGPPPGKSVDGGVPAARFPVAEAATDNPYAVRGYSYA